MDSCTVQREGGSRRQSLYCEGLGFQEIPDPFCFDLPETSLVGRVGVERFGSFVPENGPPNAHEEAQLEILNFTYICLYIITSAFT